MNNSTKSEGNPRKPFPLLRYFTITSLIAFVLVAVSLVTFYRRIAINELIKVGESKNTAITQSFSNVIWPDFESFLGSASDLDADAIRAHPETARLRQAVLEQMQGLSVIKIKIYDLEGMTVFSTEESQIGEDKSENAGFRAALNGDPASELTHRDTFSAFEGEIEDRDVISSYVPIRRGDAGVEGVFEVYDDVTPLLENISIAQRNIAIGVTLTLALLYAILFLLVRRADNLIKQQFIEQQKAEEEIQEAYQREENINRFFHFTLLNIIGYVNRGSEKAALLTYLEQIKQQFDALKYWVHKSNEESSPSNTPDK
ncbi:MAG TPA: hypothetical protein VFQ13_01720 [Anaerolineales bacterium]|nr:hypothetical protein [Anaerolineales bacterium]